MAFWASMTTTTTLAISTRFILTQTHHPGNVGAAARALKVMGFDELWLVKPHDPNVLGRKKCLDGASGAVNVLRQARAVNTLNDALVGTSLVCGTGMPMDMHQTRQQPLLPYVEPRPYFSDLIVRLTMDDDDPVRRGMSDFSIAFVFGNERHGMTLDDMNRCDCMLGIPTNPSFGSLNLASAVQLIAYDWRQALGGFENPKVKVQED